MTVDGQIQPVKPVDPVSHTWKVLSLAFDSKGEKLASGDDQGVVTLWDMTERSSIFKLTGQNNKAINSVAFSPNNEILAAGSCAEVKDEGEGCQKGEVRLWQVADGQEVGQLTGHSSTASSVAFSPDGKWFASGGEDGTIILWEVGNNWTATIQINGHEGAVTQLTFSADSTKLASSSFDNTIAQWEVPDGKRSGPTLKDHKRGVTSVAWLEEGFLASGSLDGQIILWNSTTGEIIGEPLAGHTAAVRTLAVSPDGVTLAVATTQNMVTLWDTTQSVEAEASLEPKRRLISHTNWVESVAFSPDGQTLASGSWDKTILLWDVNDDEALSMPLESHEDGVTALAFDASGQRLASGSRDTTIIIWDVSNPAAPQQIEHLTAHGGGIYEIAFNPIDDQWLASGSADGTIILWSLETFRPEHQFAGHTSGVNTVAFNHDGTILASGSDDKTIILWEVATGNRLCELVGHESWVRRVRFSPDGQTLASTSGEQTLRLWDVKSCESLGPALSGFGVGYQTPIRGLAFADENTLVSGNDNGTIVKWDLDLASWHQRACQVAARSLTWEEWQQYFSEQGQSITEKQPETYRRTCPESEAPLYLTAIVGQADTFAQANKEDEAKKVFEEAVTLALETQSAVFSNQVCWFGSLNSFAEMVLPACNQAVNLASDKQKGKFQDSRGIALALMGENKEAVIDFKAFQSWVKENNWPEKYRISRDNWIYKLEAGEQPFDPETLKGLRTEQ